MPVSMDGFRRDLALLLSKLLRYDVTSSPLARQSLLPMLASSFVRYTKEGETA